MLSPQSLVIAALLLVTQAAATDLLDFGPGLEAAIPCQECPVTTLHHYEAKACTAVFDDAVSVCCPASFNCTSESERGIKDTDCYYKGVSYAEGDSVPVENPCEKGCYCRKAYVEGEPAEVECAQVECPSLFVPVQSGCRSIYNIDLCCEVNTECEADNTTELRSTALCHSEDKEYQYGDKIYFTAQPCQYCVCTENFTGPFGTNCTTVQCGMEYRDRKELRDGCTPIYFNGRCCNIDWICPNSTRVKPEPDQVATVKASADGHHCTLGNIVAPRNATLPTDNCNLNCRCVTPPDFTCVQYTNCDDANAALATGLLQ